MPPQETANWIVSPHAKQRAWERYGIVFPPQKWANFCNTLQKEKFSIRLGNDASGSCRFACYFQGTWFLVGCSLHRQSGIVSTFLPADALTETDKIILQSDDRYRRVGNDPWNIMFQRLSGGAVAGKRTTLPDIRISQEDLPPDFEQSEKLLKKEIEP
jgi:hypothetical protein